MSTHNTAGVGGSVASGPLKVGRSKYGRSGIVRFARYNYGGTAMKVFSEDGEPLYVATVFMEGHPLPNNEVWIKDWSENEGVAGPRIPAGYVEAIHATLTESAIAAMEERS